MKKIMLYLFISLIGINNLSAQLTIGGATTPSGLVNSIIGGGVVVSNILYTGSDTAASTFQCTGNLGISSGIILATGDVTNAIGPNNTDAITTDFGTISSDSQLVSIATGDIHDASILEFDIIAISDTVEFNYVFGSEEYPEYVCSSFNDVFGFFITGLNSTGGNYVNQNIALIPGTVLPVAINTINPGIAGFNSGGGVCNSLAYSNLYVDRTGDTTLQYDGTTTVLTAMAVNLIPGQTYHFKLAIADVSDGAYDSGVFIEGGSFRSHGLPAVYNDGLRMLTDTIHLCNSPVILSVVNGFNYLWNTGATTSSIYVNTPGNYSVKIMGTNSNDTVNSPVITFILDGSPIPTPTLSIIGNTINSSVDSSFYIYSWTYNGIPIAGSDSSSLIVSQSGCYGLTIQQQGNCYVISDSICYQASSTGINNFVSSVNCTILPNPNSGTFTFIIPTTDSQQLTTINITNMLGQLVYATTAKETKQINIVLNQPPGLYFVSVISDGKREVVKLVVN